MQYFPLYKGQTIGCPLVVRYQSIGCSLQGTNLLVQYTNPLLQCADLLVQGANLWLSVSLKGTNELTFCLPFILALKRIIIQLPIREPKPGKCRF